MADLELPKGPHPELAVPACWVIRFEALREVSWKKTDRLGRLQSKGNKGRHKNRQSLFIPHSLALQRPGWWSAGSMFTPTCRLSIYTSFQCEGTERFPGMDPMAGSENGNVKRVWSTLSRTSPLSRKD